MEEKNRCPICNTPETWKEKLPKNLFYKINCKRCGKFKISHQVLSNIHVYDEQIKRALLSHWIRINQGNVELELTLDKVKNILENNSLPKPKEQANNLIHWIGTKLTKPDEEFFESLENLISVVGAYDSSGVDYVFQYLKDEGIFHSYSFEDSQDVHKRGVTLSFKGWDHYYELKHKNKDSRLAFMAMQFGEEPLTTIYKTVIKDAVEKTGFDIRKLDEEKKAGLIDDKLRVEIRRSKFLIADLTHDNNGAYWEAGFAEGLEMPVIYICEEEKFKTTKSHFDTNHHLTVTWKNDEEGLKKFSNELKATIRATFPTEAKMED